MLAGLGGVRELLDRVPFADADIERSLNLRPGLCRIARHKPGEIDRAAPEEARRLAEYLARYVVRGLLDYEDVHVWEETAALAPGRRSRLRLTIRCPRCHGLYLLGSVSDLVVIDTDERDDAGRALGLVYHTGPSARCPAAIHGGCDAPAAEWAPRPVRLHDTLTALEALP